MRNLTARFCPANTTAIVVIPATVLVWGIYKQMSKYELVIPFEELGVGYYVVACRRRRVELDELIEHLQAWILYLKELNAAGVKYVIEDACITFETDDAATADRLDFHEAEENSQN
jgi:hypothetical protein